MTEASRWERVLDASRQLRRLSAYRVLALLRRDFEVFDPNDLPAYAVSKLLRELQWSLEDEAVEREMQALHAKGDDWE